MTISQGLERSRPAGASGGGSGMGGGLVPAQYLPPESLRPTLIGDRWSVVAGHPLVSQIAAEVLAQGGNAVDAGVAAGLASNVVQVDMANFGGIAPILVRQAGSDEVHSIAGVGRWGQGADLATIRSLHGGTLPLGGVPSIVPAAPAAWLAALQRFGTWSFADVVAPAIDLARRGFPLDVRTAQSLQIMGAGFSKWQSSAQVYWPGGRPPRAGQRLVQPELAELMAELAHAEQGGSRTEALRAVHRHFYTGPIAEQIAEFVSERGGYLTPADFATYEAEVALAPSVRFGDWQVHVTSGWSQGLIIAQALAILDGFDLKALEHNGTRYLHLLIEALDLAFSDREMYLADPDFMTVTPADLLSPQRVQGLQAMIGERALPKLATRDLTATRLRSTTSIVVTDAGGTSFGASPSDTLDGAPIIPGLGILCSPRGVQSRLVDDHPNSLQPGKRPCVTPAAAIALRAGAAGGPADVWTLACPGGDVIVQAIVQSFLNVEVFGMTLQQSVEAPRIAAFNAPSAFHPHPDADNVVFVESRVSERVRAELTQAGHDVTLWPDFEFDAGSVQMTMLATQQDGGRVVLAAADPRRSAYGIAR